MRTLDSFNFENKEVLLRCDLNSPVVNGKVILNDRIRESATTINELKKKKAKIIILSHQSSNGNPGFISLKQHSTLLNKFAKVKFVRDTLGKKSALEIKKLKPGQALLLENIRFIDDEFFPGKAKKNKIIKFFLPLIDIYINDSFSVCHRNQTSIVSFPRYFPSCIGRLFESEINAFKKINLKNCIFILGGAKLSDNIKLLGKNKVLSCGLFGQICSIAKGHNFGAQNKFLKKQLYLVPRLEKKLKNVLTPIDNAIEVKKKRRELSINEFPSRYRIFDIGQKTIEVYADEIKKANSIFMKGPAGYIEEKKFSKGTTSLLKAIKQNKGFSLIAGGHLNKVMQKYKLNKKSFGYVSLSGGALISFIAKEKLPGLEALKKGK